MSTPQARAYERLARAAKAAGCPCGQVENFIRAGYTPQPMQVRFHAAARMADHNDGPLEIGVGGSRGPGKSHAVFAQLSLDDCQRQPGLNTLYLRKVGKKAREQFDHLRRRVCSGIKHHYKSGAGIVEFPNGSSIITGHFRSERDIDDYLGMEYGAIVVEEATTLSQTKAQAIRDSCRSALPGWRPRIYWTTNPGGVGHGWFKKTFIIPWQAEKEVDTRFIFGTVEDNQFIDSVYRKRLEQNTGWRLRAYRYGDWDIAAGQYFTTWQRAVHIRPADSIVERTGSWIWWGAMDYGFIHPTVWYLLGMDQRGTIHVVDEHSQNKWPVPRQADAFKEMVARHGLTLDDLRTIEAGGDVWRTESTGTTIEQQYAAEGIKLTRANMSREGRATRLLEYLGDVDRNVTPKLVIADRCGHLANCIPAMEHDPSRPEVVLKTNANEDTGEDGDDPYDSLGYGLMAVDKFRRIVGVIH